MYFEPENVIRSTELGATRVNGEIILTPTISFRERNA